ncbi:MAG: phosphoribosylformylglycinamidine synthase [Christensenellales bacterium]|nr:phosphoribosylformylglycinamidine synthase [Christensenellales bacterium]
MVYRLYVEKKPGFEHEAHGLLEELRSFLGISGLKSLRVLNRYDVENIEEKVFRQAITGVFSEPLLDIVYESLPTDADYVLAQEYLPGQFDQRADSAAQCIQLMAQCERPTVRTATVYLMNGDLTAEELERIRQHVINPVERREASLEEVLSLKAEYDLPDTVATLDGFIRMDDPTLFSLIKTYALAMDEADIAMVREYFRSIDRDPTITELRMLDTYWSDHCRHTTFLTELTDVSFEDEDVQRAFDRYMEMRREIGRTKPVTLMDIGTIGAKVLQKRGQLTDLDESEEINACTIKIKVKVDGEEENWLLLFKNETHNHPTEIEPFGGAATCIGGAIRDPLSGRSYVYQAMRVTGAADPTQPVGDTIPGKLPQRRLVTTAAAGYSSYGNQIGLATGLVEEIYHPGYAAKRMEIGAVIGAAPQKNVRRETPAPGDVVLMLGGRTGRDGCGGATGSSKSHTAESLNTCGAEVQKGNAPEERKIQRLFRCETAAKLIKRCNDFGAGGVSVAIGELADGLRIDLNKVPRKYDGLDGTELAISESQERMAVVIAPEDVSAFEKLADEENIECTAVAVVTEEPRLVMEWNGKTIVDISRDFLNSNGASKRAKARVVRQERADADRTGSFIQRIRRTVSDLNQCTQRGLVERFDSTNGAASLLMPFGGKRQLTPAQSMASRVSVQGRESDTASVMAYGFDPYLSEKSPYFGAYTAVVHSIAKVVAAGAGTDNIHLTFQEYFQRMTSAPETWGKPLSALLGALEAQVDFGAAAIGGKDSMSGTFENLHVPPTLVSFAVGVCDADDVRSNEFKKAGNRVGLITPSYRENGLPSVDSQKAVFAKVTELLRSGKALSAYAIGAGGMASAAFKMAVGNGLGFRFTVDRDDLFDACYGAFLVEFSSEGENIVGETTVNRDFSDVRESVSMDELETLWKDRLEGVFRTEVGKTYATPKNYSYQNPVRKHASLTLAKPRVLIPVFPGTNCEFDTERAFLIAGAQTEIMVIRNLTAAAVSESVHAFAEKLQNAQIVFIPGGFSGGDEPDGSGKFITAFFRNPMIADKVHELLKNRDGLMGGICNGFQALIKLGLVPYGEIRDAEECEATLTFNDIGRHQSRLVHTRVASNKSPWLANTQVGDVYTCPVSHGEGRFIADPELVRVLAENGQIATQYCDNDGMPTMDILFNPNGSIDAIEGITSPDGRVFGKMGHSERVGYKRPLYINVDGQYDNGMFASAVQYFAK